MSYRFTRAERDAMNALPEFIEQHLPEKLNMKVLCRATGMSYEKLNEGFQQLFGRTLSSFITERRMEHAKRLLAEKEWTIKQVAGLCGYKNVKSFHRAFRRYFDLTPSVMIQQLQPKK